MQKEKHVHEMWAFALASIIFLVGIAWIYVSASTGITKCTGKYSENIKCWREHYETLTAKKGVAAAFSDIRPAFKEHAVVRAFCHQLTHIIGRQGALRYPDISEAYSHGDDFCQSGYYHGVMESIAQQVGNDKILSRINQICEPLAQKKKYGIAEYNCVHGLGHGLMSIREYDLFKALDDCDALNNSWWQESCWTGVFMQNVMAAIGEAEEPTVYLKADDPMYPCTGVDDKYKRACYLNQTSYALRVLKYDWAKVFELCSKVGKEFAPSCYQSLGRDIAPFSGNFTNLEQAQTLCYLGKDDTAVSNCAIGVAQGFVWQDLDDKKAMQFCESFPKLTISKPCVSYTEEYYSSFK